MARLAAFALFAIWASPSPAQFVPRPAEEMPEPREPGGVPTEAPIELAPSRPALPPITPGALRVAVRSIEVLGSTVFSESDLSAVTQKYIDRELATEDLASLTENITELYRARGYVTSGAILPDQDLAGGRLVIQVIEGRVDEIVVEGNRDFRTGYFRSRLERAVRAPVSIHALSDQMVVFQRHPRIERVNAVLEPTARLGVTRLRVTVREASPWSVALEASNDSPPTIGSWGGGPSLTRSNIAGYDDELFGSAWFTEGLQQFEVRERVPINRFDTELIASYQYTESEVIEPSLEFLDIQSKAHQVDLELRHPLVRSGPHELWTGIVGSWARTKSSLLGETACFNAGVEDCEPTTSVIRLRQDYLWRSRSSVVSARSTLNFGFASDLLDSTGERSSNAADSEFVSWLAQFWWLQRLPIEDLGWAWPRSVLLVTRGDVQLSNDPLLPTEQIAVGGPYTVRGYRRNRLVRDNALMGSVELRVPVWTRPFGEPIVELGPFFDVGRAADVKGPNGLRTLSSVGVSVRLNLGMGVRTEASYGYRLRTGADEGEGLQRDGVYLRVIWDVF